MQLNKIINGDSAEVLKTIEDNSVDLVCCDPPYAISFMQKSWDAALPSVEIWKECLRVLKPGSFCFVMSAPRQDVLSQMIVRLGDAGFKTDFTSLYWTYASGFPKAMNIGKMVDKRKGRNVEEYKALGIYLKVQRGDKSQKEISKFFPSKTGGLTGCVANWEMGMNVPTKSQWEILRRELNLDDHFDELIEREEAEREIIGKANHKSGIANKTEGHYTVGGTTAIAQDITVPATDQAKALDGSYGGFQPKPAVEVIIVCMKPLSEKTYVDQAMENGKGVTWLDNARIPSGETLTYKGMSVNSIDAFNRDDSWQPEDIGETTVTGRFPANLLVSDNILDDGTVQKSGKAVRKNIGISQSGERYGGFSGDTASDIKQDLGYADSGGFSRFFSLDKWAEQLPFLIVPKASKSEKNKGLEEFEVKTIKHLSGGDYKGNPNREDIYKNGTPTKNHHPTVKPLKLMSYLVTLGSQKGDLVLDPFCGSGTTCLASKELGRNYIGIEREAEYAKIAEARLAGSKPENLLF